LAYDDSGTIPLARRGSGGIGCWVRAVARDRRRVDSRSMKRQVIGGTLGGKVHPHERNELLGQILVTLAIVPDDVPHPQTRAEHVRYLVGQRPNEAWIRFEVAVRIAHEWIVAEKEMVQGVNIEAPVATAGGDRVEARWQVVEGATGLSVEQDVAGQEREGRKDVRLVAEAWELFCLKKLAIPVESRTARVIQNREGPLSGRRFWKQLQSGAPFENSHATMRQPYRLREALGGARQRIASRDGRVPQGRSRDERQNRRRGDGKKPGSVRCESDWNVATKHAGSGWLGARGSFAKSGRVAVCHARPLALIRCADNVSVLESAGP
jgi:hypothetical protein